MTPRSEALLTFDPPPLSKEMLAVIISSFQPEKASIQEVDVKPETLNDALRGKPLVVARLLTENPWEKAALAEIYLRDVVVRSETDTHSRWHQAWKKNASQAPTIFIESGSTCACVSELLRRMAGSRPDLHVFPFKTNNHLTAWLFLNREMHIPQRIPYGRQFLVPYLFAGHLESKYHGIFPFYRTHHEQRTVEERNAYAQLRLALADTDLLLLTASRLSLQYGPLVGSRENAIFKNACYNACVPGLGQPARKEIHFFITIQKLVAHGSENQQRVGLPCNDTSSGCSFVDFHTWADELIKIDNEECFPVFSILGDNGSNSYRRSPFETDLMPEERERLSDGTSAIEMADSRFRVCDTWQELFTKAQITVKVFISFEGCAEDQNPRMRWIQDEVEAATASMAGTGISFEIKELGTLTPSGGTGPFSLAVITIAYAK